MPKKSDKEIITLSEFLTLFRETPPAVREYIKQGMPKDRGDKFHLVEVIQWLIDYYRRRIQEEKDNREIRTLNEIADYFKVEPRWINRLTKEKGLPKENRGFYNLSKVIPFFVKIWKKEIDEAKKGGETEAQARARKFKAEASLKEIELAQKRAQVVNIDDCRVIMEEILKAVRDTLLGLGDRAAPRLIGLTVPEMQEIIEKLTNEALTNASDLPNVIKRLRKIARSSDTASSDDIKTSAQT